MLIRKAESEDGLRLEAPEVIVFSTGETLPEGIIAGKLALPEQLPPDRVIRTPAVVALIPFRDFDPLRPDVESFAVAGALTSDGSYIFDHVPSGRYVAVAAVDVALPPYFRLSRSQVSADFAAFERLGRFGREAPPDFHEVRFFGFSHDALGQARDDVRPNIDRVDFGLRPEDVRKGGLRVVHVEPSQEALQEVPEELDLAIEFSEALIQKYNFVELEAFMRPEPRSGELMDNLKLEAGGQRVVFPNLELEPGTSYRFSVAFARGISGQELAEPFSLTLRPAGAQDLVLGSVSGAVRVEGDEISQASVFLYDPEPAGLEIIAGAVLEEDGTYLIEEIVEGQYSAYVEIETVSGQDLLLFFYKDG